MNTKNDQVHGIKADGLTKRDKAVMDKRKSKSKMVIIGMSLYDKDKTSEG